MKDNFIKEPNPFQAQHGTFQRDLESLINRHSIEGGSGTPDFILAAYMKSCLEAFDMATRRRDMFFGFSGLYQDYTNGATTTKPEPPEGRVGTEGEDLWDNS